MVMNLVTLNTRPFIALENGMTKYKKGDLIVTGDTKGVDGNPYVVLVSDVFRDSI